MEINKGKYDYLNAIGAGLVPKIGEHWPTRVSHGPNEGLLLKYMGHESLLKGLLEEMDLGYNFMHKNPHTDRTHTFDTLGPILSQRFAEKSYGK